MSDNAPIPDELDGLPYCSGTKCPHFQQADDDPADPIPAGDRCGLTNRRIFNTDHPQARDHCEPFLKRDLEGYRRFVRSPDVASGLFYSLLRKALGFGFLSMYADPKEPGYVYSWRPDSGHQVTIRVDPHQLTQIVSLEAYAASIATQARQRYANEKAKNRNSPLILPTNAKTALRARMNGGPPGAQ